jgi:hypothetical protein
MKALEQILQIAGMLRSAALFDLCRHLVEQKLARFSFALKVDPHSRQVALMGGSDSM